MSKKQETLMASICEWFPQEQNCKVMKTDVEKISYLKVENLKGGKAYSRKKITQHIWGWI